MATLRSTLGSGLSFLYNQNPFPHLGPTRTRMAIDHSLPNKFHPSYCTILACSSFRACGPDSAQLVPFDVRPSLFLGGWGKGRECIMHRIGRLSVRRVSDSRIDSSYWPFAVRDNLYRPRRCNTATSRWGAGGTNLPKSTKARGRSGIRTHDPEWALPRLRFPPIRQCFRWRKLAWKCRPSCSASAARAALFGVEWIRHSILQEANVSRSMKLASRVASSFNSSLDSWFDEPETAILIVHVVRSFLPTARRNLTRMLG